MKKTDQLARPDQVSMPLPPSAPLVPTMPIVAKQTYASVMSYVGITRRTIAWYKRVGSRGALMAWLAAVGAFYWLVQMYVVITVWYLTVYVLFGVFMIPWRLIRRSQRKSQHLQAVQLATMQAMLVNQQQVLRDQRSNP